MHTEGWRSCQRGLPCDCCSACFAPAQTSAGESVVPSSTADTYMEGWGCCWRCLVRACCPACFAPACLVASKVACMLWPHSGQGWQVRGRTGRLLCLHAVCQVLHKPPSPHRDPQQGQSMRVLTGTMAFAMIVTLCACQLLQHQLCMLWPCMHRWDVSLG